MYTIDFLAALQSRYENINKATLDDIEALVKNLTNKERKSLWDAFIDSYEFSTPPKRATFRKIMYRLNFNENKTGLETYSYCKNCRTSYPNWTAICPSCGSTTILTADKPEHYVLMQRHCETCQRFVEGVSGAECPRYGLGSHNWGVTGDEYDAQIAKCKACVCKRCCYEERMIHGNYSVYKDMVAQGEFVGGHIPKQRT